MNKLDSGHRVVVLYYLATPLFFLIDYYYGRNLRIVALESYPSLKLLYYLFCGLSGLWMLRSRLVSDVLALLESSVNILLLIVGVLSPYFRAIEAAARGEVIAVTTPEQVMNFIMAAAVWAIAFYSNRLSGSSFQQR